MMIGVVRTDKWLNHYKGEWANRLTLEQKQQWHQKMLIAPLQPLFKNAEFSLQRHFIHLGLISPHEDCEKVTKHFIEHHYWAIISEHFHSLKKKWKAPDIPIYILPASSNQETIKNLGGKNGLTVDNAIILFLDEGLSDAELKAMITHEFHHRFRLFITKEKEESISLLESMIMEGLAELAVQKEVGEKYIAIWTNIYNIEEMIPLFQQWIEPHLFTKGRGKHLHYLYGGGMNDVPRWLGYCCGYHIVQSALRHFKGRSIEELTTIKSVDWLKASCFYNYVRGRKDGTSKFI
ncbi:DUF2268 domain-containing putative Zn-dependent protease [Alkalihalophilus lindianensis]|uniref:DUF2268 domain-containing putative Zn-dependent protease n=1 Tax=Alkalihalophilus lindianensis TaxID=1630542 RepID=A0ABU3XC91_9BACI|nr:DUF2268 domain-containing putative Zn-dependent protease [Alkalihalophilus lindianensis]MDV2685049.1 DUF2268 domain-containing putative Zn-dependent protease [Alkalihalophilus lindianensis]